MKWSIHPLSAILIIVSALFGCQHNNDVANVISSRILNKPACKQFTKSGEYKITEIMSAVEYSFDMKTGILYVKHINAGFNCAPEVIYCYVQQSDKSLIFTEREKSQGVKCQCLYDLEIEVKGVKADKYRIEFVEPHIGNQEKLIFYVDLIAAPTGKYIVSRTEYPWSGGTVEPAP